MAMNEEDKGSKGVKKKKSLGLSARQSFKRQRAMGRMRGNREAIFSIIGLAFVAFLIFFMLSGAVNQRKFIEWCGEAAHNIGETVSSWFNPDKVKITDQGVYIDGAEPDGSKELEPAVPEE